MVKVACDGNGQARYFSRAPIPWHRDTWSSLTDVRAEDSDTASPLLRHIGLYGSRVRALQQFVRASPSPLEQIEQLEQLRWFTLNHTVQVVVTAQSPHAGVDPADDLLRVRALWENQK